LVNKKRSLQKDHIVKGGNRRWLCVMPSAWRALRRGEFGRDLRRPKKREVTDAWRGDRTNITLSFRLECSDVRAG